MELNVCEVCLHALDGFEGFQCRGPVAWGHQGCLCECERDAEALAR